MQERVAKFSLTTNVEANVTKFKNESNTKLHVGIEEICLEILKEKAVADTLIPKTRILFDFTDEAKEEPTILHQNTNISLSVEPIKIHLAFRHLQFFAKASAKILATLPELTAASAQTQQKANKPQPQVLPPPQPAKALHKSMKIQGGLGLFETIIFDDSTQIGKGLQYPWLRMTLTKAGGMVEIKEMGGKKEQKIDALIESFAIELAKRVDSEQFLSEENIPDEMILPYMIVL